MHFYIWGALSEGSTSKQGDSTIHRSSGALGTSTFNPLNEASDELVEGSGCTSKSEGSTSKQGDSTINGSSGALGTSTFNPSNEASAELVGGSRLEFNETVATLGIPANGALGTSTSAGERPLRDPLPNRVIQQSTGRLDPRHFYI